MQIIPTILEKEFINVEFRLNQLVKKSPWVQIDVIDNVFTYGKSFELELLNSYQTKDEFIWDIHLIVKDPQNWINKCLFVGAQRIIGQVEMMTNRQSFIDKIKNSGLEAGLAFNIDTPIDNNIPLNTDLVLLMGYSAGFNPLSLDKKIFEKIKKIKNLGFKVAVDGGVDENNINELSELKTDIIYSGSRYFHLIDTYQNRNGKN